MPKKLSITFIRSQFEKEGYNLLDVEYKNNRHKFNCICPKGHRYKVNWFTWDTGKRRCPYCAKCAKYTIEEVIDSFKSEGYTLLSNEYVNSKSKLDYMCPEGHRHSVVYYSWKKGYRCPYCNKLKKSKPTFVMVQQNTLLKGIIYKVTNKINDKVYIGQTIHSLHERKIKHISLSNSNNVKTYFHRALKKYGEMNFTWEIIEYCDSKEELDEMEFHYIKQYNSYIHGYNMTFGGEGTIGRVCEESTKNKISKSKSGKTMSQEIKNKLSSMRRGVKKSEKHIAKVVEAKSKYWKIIFPDGTIEVIKNLSSFCREHDISDRGMWLVARGDRVQHKGYTCKRLSTY